MIDCIVQYVNLEYQWLHLPKKQDKIAKNIQKCQNLLVRKHQLLHLNQIKKKNANSQKEHDG